MMVRWRDGWFLHRMCFIWENDGKSGVLMQKQYKNAAFLTTAMVVVVLALRAWITPHMLNRQDGLFRLSYVVIAVMLLTMLGVLIWTGLRRQEPLQVSGVWLKPTAALGICLLYTSSVKQIGADATILSSQKGLALSPGMSFVNLSRRLYTERVVKNPRRSMYLDFQEHVENLKRGQTPFTPAVGVALELHDMLVHLKREGLDSRLTHVRRLAEDFRGRVGSMGLDLPATPLSCAITPVIFPDGNAQMVYERLKLDYDTVVTPVSYTHLKSMAST